MRALICGISGQDGAYLAQLLLEKGYEVFGTSRDAGMTSFSALDKLGIKDKVTLLSMAVTDFRSVITALKQSDPDEIYNLAGQSSVGLSFEQPVETFESVSVATLNLLEAIRFIDKPIKLFSAGSSECFGDVGEHAADESTLFKPRSPYAVAKAAAFWEIVNYRDAYNLFACTGILFNHESPFRPRRFVTQKIIHSVVNISRGKQKKLKLGNIDIQRDWGWAPEYVQAMWLMLQEDKPDDYIIATGQSYSLKDFIRYAFEAVDLDWQEYVETDPSFIRPSELLISRANPDKAKHQLGWEAQFKLPDIVREMMTHAKQSG